MPIIRVIFYFLLILTIFSCSKKEAKKSIIFEKSQEDQMIEAYKQGLEELNSGDVIYAARKFNEVEIIYPQSIWAPRASLMAAYSYYSQSYFDDSIIELNRFLKKYPNHSNKDYAYYLLGLSYYDQMIDETKDTQIIYKAKNYFEKVVNDYPNTDFALDSEFKLELIKELLAAKEMYIARYYLDREKWIPALNRFKLVVTDYDDTIFIEEALFRLVELNYKIGLENEAKKYAYLLGYNYQSSEWYSKSYTIFNKNYSNVKIKEDKSRTGKILENFKKLLK
tara:strand:- start:784 stop:1623 length:840 start_codon:yes stop_codon:yes gene_type:complete